MADETNYGFERITILLLEEGYNIPFVMGDLPRNMGVGHVMHLTEGDEAINNLKKRLQFVQRRQPHRPIPPSTVTRGQRNAVSGPQRRRRLVETGAPGRPDVVRNS